MAELTLRSQFLSLRNSTATLPNLNGHKKHFSLDCSFFCSCILCVKIFLFCSCILCVFLEPFMSNWVSSTVSTLRFFKNMSLHLQDYSSTSLMAFHFFCFFCFLWPVQTRSSQAIHSEKQKWKANLRVKILHESQHWNLTRLRITVLVLATQLYIVYSCYYELI